MPTFERTTRIRAPLDEVWTFHSDPAGLVALTPPWMRLRVEATTGPDGEDDPAVLEEGARIVASVRPFGLGPRQRWVSEILSRERDESHGSFTDEMVAGPFREWVHTHEFTADGDETIVRDRVEYALPRPLPAALAPFAEIGFDSMFRHRHRKTAALLETD